MVVYSALLGLALVAASPVWLWRMLRQGRYRAGLAQRLGRLPAALDEVAPARLQAPGLVWLHAVSVGEVLAVERLVRELGESLPGWLVVVSTTTDTGQKLAAERLGVPVFYFPLDFAFAVRPYLRALRPSLFVTVESELWPRMIAECSRARVPVAVVNARVSDRTFRRTMGFRKLWLAYAGKVTLFLAQGEESAARLHALGVAGERVRVTGNLKYEAAELQPNALVERVRPLLGGLRLVVAGSTLDGEEATLLAAWPSVLAAVPDAILVISPRHPARFDAVAALMQAGSYRFARLSREVAALEPGMILELDTLGDLAAFYQLADVAFVGGSLVKRGGHNPLEAARFGVPVVMGPSYENFREMVEGMRGADAIRITDADGLAAALIEALVAGTAMGARGRSFFEAQAGATARTIDALPELIA